MAKKRKYDVITVGSATVDVFADSASELIKIKSAKETEELIAYPSGSKILIKNIQFLTGGGGTNTAVALARLGHKVGYLGNLGKDANAITVMNVLKEEGIEFLGVKDKGLTGFSVVLKSLEHDRAILAYKGMNNDLTDDEVNYKKLDTSWFYFSSMMGKAFDTIINIAEFADKEGIRIAFNPSNYLAEKGTDYLKELLSRTTYLILNKEEAELLVGRGEDSSIMKRLSETGPELVVMTEGRKGAQALYKGYLYSISPSQQKVIETTGAGDAFAASFLSGMIKKNDVKFALKLALVNAESVIKYVGAKEKLLTYRQALAEIKKSKCKVKKRKV